MSGEQTENYTERRYPREHRCPGCDTWGFELSYGSNQPMRCAECGVKIPDMDTLDSRPRDLHDRIAETIQQLRK